jgi:hypothetical protein
MDGLIVLVVLVVPLFATPALRKTELFWLPGAALIVLGLVAFGTMPESHSDDSVVGALAGTANLFGGIAALGYGFVCLAVGAAGHRRHVRRTAGYPPPIEPPVELPPVTVVKDLSNS